MPRPTLNPTDEERRLVKSLAAFGVPQEQIARRVGIRSVKTLKSTFAKNWMKAVWTPTATSPRRSTKWRSPENIPSPLCFG